MGLISVSRIFRLPQIAFFETGSSQNHGYQIGGVTISFFKAQPLMKVDGIGVDRGNIRIKF